MTLVAGIDVGNATTEIVVADTATTPPTPIAWDRARTRGRKGSTTAAVAAVELLHRLERAHDLHADLVVLAPQRPVDTGSTVLAEPPADTGRLVLLGAGRATPAGHGSGAGRPVHVDDEPDPSLGPVVLVATDPIGYRRTSARVRSWIGSGADVVGVLLAGDEAVLVSRRIPGSLPVLDQVDTLAALAAVTVAVEVGETGRPARRLTDAVHLAALLGLDSAEHAHAEALARAVRGVGDVAIGVLAAAPPRPAMPQLSGWWEDGDGRRADLLTSLVDGPRPHGVRRMSLPGKDSGALAVDDLWGVDLTALAQDAVARPGSVEGRAVALATLAAAPENGLDDLRAVVSRASRRPVHVVESEAAAARAGALTTPAASAAATVVDVGGGTIDVVLADGSAQVLAGAGDLLTVATATLLGIAGGQAEWVKRGPCARVEAPHVLLQEDGTRRFLDVPAATGSVGWLVVPGPAGSLPFDRRLSPPEWRALRLRLKRAVLGDNIARGGALGVADDVLVVGGPAGDDEVLDCVARALPGSVPGRGDVAGMLGHRWAVAFGLVVLASRDVGVLPP